MTATPYRIEYRGPAGWTLWTDEDGVHVRTPQGEILESGEVQTLIRLVAEAQIQRDAGSVPAPRVPSPEELRKMWPSERAERDAKAASRAVYRELSPNQKYGAAF